jgi:hypothetical protein
MARRTARCSRWRTPGVSLRISISATPGITSLEITARLHDFIAAWPEGSSYLGFLFAQATQPAEVECALREAHNNLHFTLTPRLPVEHPLRARS